jgi:RNA polymerase sigma-70 factor (ECF subfamily)
MAVRLTDELVRQAHKGETTALERLYRRHLNDVYRCVYVRVGTQADAEDLTSETFLRMVENLRQYRGTGTFRSWLLGIARHVVNDFWRAHYTINQVPLDRLSVQCATNPFSDDGPHDGPQNQDDLGLLIKEGLSKLPDHYRRTLELRFLEGKSIQETAQSMKCTETTAKVRQHRALEKLAQIMAKAEDSRPLQEVITSGADDRDE